MAQKKTIELDEHAKEILRSLNNLPEAMPKGIAKALYTENQYTISHIQNKYLSFSRSRAPVEIGLRVQSGALRNSLWSPYPETIGAEEVSTSIGNFVKAKGSDVNYAAVHEFGAHVRVGERKGTVRLRTNAAGELLRQPGRRGAIFARADHKRAREVQYTAGPHEFDIPARAPIQRGIEDRLKDYGAAVSLAVVQAMEGTE